ncbi:MAG: TIM barrel protein [Candidatus Lokiarchaeota archaeon]|nr:TIM barrel protein [Candidatus Lokiarchaeota archaeon]
MLLYAIANHSSYLFSRAMGASIGLEEPEPENIIRQLSAFSREAARVLVADYPGIGKVLAPAVQYGNESDIYFDDPDLVDVLVSEANATEPAYAFVHQTSDKQPLKPGFREKMARLLPMCRRLGTRNITIHLPLDRDGTTPALLDELCAPGFLDAVRKSRVSIDLENNWHASWFGFTDHLIDFYAALDKRLDAIGEGRMKEWFGMTFDCGHFFAQYCIAGRPLRPDLDRLFSALADRIRTLHLHGNDGTSDQHKCFEPPPAGSVDTSAFRSNQQALLTCLPALDLAGRAREGEWDMVIVSEIAVPFTTDAYLAHSRLIFDAITGRPCKT